MKQKLKHSLAGISWLLMFSFISLTTFSQIEAGTAIYDGKLMPALAGHVNIGIPVSESDDLVVEGGFYYFWKEDYPSAVAPILAGYRYSLDRSGTGWFLEPMLGYALGGTDYEKLDEFGQPVFTDNGEWVYRKMQGISAAVTFGYQFYSESRFQPTLGIRLTRVFVGGGDPSPSLITLRLSQRLQFGRRQ